MRLHILLMEVFLIAQAVGILAAVVGSAILGVYLGRGTWASPLRATCLILAVSLLIQATAVVQLRISSPDLSLRWYLVPAILGEGVVVGLMGFVGFDSLLRQLALVTSALAPLMLMCIRNIEK